MRRLVVAVLSIFALAGAIRNAAAEDTLKVAIPQKGAWDAGIAELGQRGGIFKSMGSISTSSRRRRGRIRSRP